MRSSVNLSLLNGKGTKEVKLPLPIQPSGQLSADSFPRPTYTDHALSR